MTDKVREEFEKAVLQVAPKAVLNGSVGQDGKWLYSDDRLNHSLFGFQLGRASLAREVPVGSMRIAASLLGSNRWDDDVEQAEAFLATVEELRK